MYPLEVITVLLNWDEKELAAHRSVLTAHVACALTCTCVCVGMRTRVEAIKWPIRCLLYTSRCV